MKLTKAALQRKQPVTDEVLIPRDDTQTQALADARQTVENTRQRVAFAQVGGELGQIAQAEQALKAAEQAVAAIRDEIRKTGTCFTLVGVGRVRWDEIVLEHPVTEEQEKADADKPEDQRLIFNPKTFWPALLAECVPDSTLLADDWRKEVFESKAWGPAELRELRDRAAAVNQGSRILSLGN
jgi:hypothetical protein